MNHFQLLTSYQRFQFIKLLLMTAIGKFRIFSNFTDIEPMYRSGMVIALLPAEEIHN